MQAFIDFVMRNLRALWPITCVSEWQAAMRTRNGRIVGELGPGLHWRWLFVETIEIRPRTEMVVDLATGAVTTTDGNTVVVSANVGYELHSIAKNWRSVWSSDNSLKALAIGRLSSETATKSWDGLHGGSRIDLEAQLRQALNSDVEEWGLRVTRFHLTDCVKAKQYRVFMDQTNRYQS